MVGFLGVGLLGFFMFADWGCSLFCPHEQALFLKGFQSDKKEETNKISTFGDSLREENWSLWRGLGELFFKVV